jgi:hypothetical protein
MTEPTPEDLAAERRRFVADLLVTEGIPPMPEVVDAIISEADAQLGDLDNWRPTGLLNRPGITVAPSPASPGDSGDSEPAADVSPSPQRNSRQGIVYTQIGDVHDPRTGAKRFIRCCDRCGAAVADMDKHTAWHEVGR